MRSPRILLVLVAVTSVVAPTALAEVRAIHHPARGWSVVVAVEDGRTWTPVPSHDLADDVLNPGGDVGGDGRPAVGLRPGTGLPEALWPRATEHSYELAFAQHDGSSWARTRLVTTEPRADDVNPFLDYDDHGRSLIVWQRLGEVSGVEIAGLSIDGRAWGQETLQPRGWLPVGLQTDGEGFHVATILVAQGLIQFHRADFPFPDGGPALPFPDDTLRISLLAEEVAGQEGPRPRSDDDGGLAPGSDELASTMAATTLEMHRSGRKVWADWVTLADTVRYIAFLDGQVLDRGSEPLRGPNQVGNAREAIRRHVEGL